MKKIFRKEGLWLGCFLLVVGIFFYPTLLHKKLPVPSDTLVGLYHPWRDSVASMYPRGLPFKNFLITDPIRQQIPWRKVAIDQWKNLSLPLWNGYSFSGTPLAANVQAAVFYPLNIIFFILDFPIAWTVLIMLQPLLGGTFLYLYLRNLKFHSLSSLMGAIVWSLGGFNVAWLTWGTIGHVALWLPLILLAIDKQLVGLYVVALALSFFAGHSQVFLYIVVLSVMYVFFRVKKANKFLLWSFIIFIFITSIQWVPMVNFFLQTSRLNDIVAWQSPGWFLPWQHLAQFLAPDFFGNPTTLNYWGVWNYGEFIGYASVISLIFVVLAFSVNSGRFWKIVLLTSLLFMLPNPISKLPYQLHIPVLSSLQPTRLMVLVCFSLSVLAAYGFDSFLKKPKKPLSSILIVGLALVILWIVVVFLPADLMGVAKRNLILPTALFLSASMLLFFPKKIFGYAVVTFIIIDLLRFGWKFTPFTDSKYFFPKTNTIEFLQKQIQPFRIMNLDDQLTPPNSLAYYGIETIEGYDPLYSHSYEEFIAASERGKPDISPPFGFNRIITPHNIDSPLISLLNVHYVLSLSDIDRPFLRKVFQEEETRVYEDSRRAPRAFFAERIIVEKNQQKILERLFDKNFDTTRFSIIEKPLSLLSTPIMVGEAVSILEYSSGRIVLDVQASNTRFLFVSNMFNPGWKAKIDGHNVEIYRTNYLFQGIVVPSGRHNIVLRYHL